MGGSRVVGGGWVVVVVVGGARWLWWSKLVVRGVCRWMCYDVAKQEVRVQHTCGIVDGYCRDTMDT